MTMELTQITLYPAKSMGAISLERSLVTSFGLHNDRRWMLVDDAGMFLTQRKFSIMRTIHCRLVDQGVVFTAPDREPLVANFEHLAEPMLVQVWRDSVEGLKAPQIASDWFSSLLGVRCHLVYMPENAFRQVDRTFFDADQRVGFADGFPFLLISEASLRDLNSRLATPVGMNRFRPNLVVSGAEAYAEDQWKRIRIGTIEFRVVKPCSRCVMTTIDEISGEKSREPLETLASYRKNVFGVCFGQNLVHLNAGELKLGDRVEVLA